MERTELDEKGFVFLVDNNKPYLCRMWGDSPWLFYWHVEGHWVSLRKVNQTDIFNFPRNLTEEQQDFYRKQHDKYNEQLAPKKD